MSTVFHPRGHADVSDAYRVSLAVRDLKLAAGRTVKGHKIGLTSKAMRDLTPRRQRAGLWVHLRQLVRARRRRPLKREAMNRPLVEESSSPSSWGRN